ncbi:MAG TPA: hypothetical protein VME17_05775 [Bryobacteraceae bacterium]|nr:hypothetical protein [Bryobacteraceae bacterium]
MDQRLHDGKPFLWADESPERIAKLRAGEIVVAPVGEHSPQKVPSGLIHDWVGAIFIDHTSISDVLRIVRNYDRYKDIYQPTVIDSKEISSAPTDDRFSMLLRNKSLLLKTAFDADYESSYTRLGDGRAYSVSRTTRVQEIEDYGTPDQHSLRPGAGSGIIWRLFAITRYEERDGGVYVELEAIALSRDIPGALRWFVDPIVRRVSRASLEKSLEQTQNAVRCDAQLASTKISH